MKQLVGLNVENNREVVYTIYYFPTFEKTNYQSHLRELLMETVAP